MSQRHRLHERAGFSSPARNLKFGIYIYRHYHSWHSPKITCKLAMPSSSPSWSSPDGHFVH